MAPFMLFFFFFTLLPVGIAIVLSFTNYNMFEPARWVMFDNYVRLFLDDDVFLTALKNTLTFAVLTGPISYMLLLFRLADQ